MESNSKIKFMVYQKIEYVVSAIKYLHLFPYFKTMCLRMKITSLELPSLSSPQVQESRLGKNSKFKPLMSNDQSLSLMPSTSKNNVINLLP